jgi:hypothetical protein
MGFSVAVIHGCKWMGAASNIRSDFGMLRSAARRYDAT